MMNTTWEQLSLQSFDLVMHVIPLSDANFKFHGDAFKEPPLQSGFLGLHLHYVAGQGIDVPSWPPQ